jgi:hypothetical protein
MNAGAGPAHDRFMAEGTTLIGSDCLPEAAFESLSDHQSRGSTMMMHNVAEGRRVVDTGHKQGLIVHNTPYSATSLFSNQPCSSSQLGSERRYNVQMDHGSIAQGVSCSHHWTHQAVLSGLVLGKAQPCSKERQEPR